MSEAPEDRKVISLLSREPVKQIEAPSAEEFAAELEKERQEEIALDLKVIDELRKVVERGEAVGVCFVARHLPTGNFIHDLTPNFQYQPEESDGLTALLYAGIFMELHLEMMQIASMRPMLVMNDKGVVEEIDTFTDAGVEEGDDD